jgi:hypothetical protein
MRKVYSLLCAVIVGSAAMAQTQVANSPYLRTFSKNEISAMSAPKGQINVETLFKNNNILEENFESVSGPFPAGLPAGWTTNMVTDLGNNTVPAYVVGTSTNANNGGYWPVPALGSSSNKFAYANDDGPPCDCVMISTILTGPTMDFSSVGNAAVSFDIFHDKAFGGGDAKLEISLNGGTSWSVVPFSSTNENLPDDNDVWQTIVLPLFQYSGQSSVTLRWLWSDAGSWASGFAVDNVVVGELPDFNLKTDRVVFGDWFQEGFGEGDGPYDFTRVPLTQVGAVKATAIISNNGFNTQNNVSFSLDVNGTEFTGAMSSSSITSLSKDTLSIVTTFVPSAVGPVVITATATSASGDENPLDDSASNTLLVTQHTYARDLDNAQAFWNFTGGYEAGNLFDIKDGNDSWGGIDFAIGAGSTVGAIFYGKVYQFLGFSGGDPLFEDLGIETIEHTVAANQMNTAGGNNFVTLPFSNGAIQLAPGTYLAVVETFGGSNTVRTPISGSNFWVGSWVRDAEGWFATLSIPMVRLNSDESVAVKVQTANKFRLDQNVPNPAIGNTRIDYSLSTTGKVAFEVRDIMGRLVFADDFGTLPAGKQNIYLNVGQFAPGAYTYSLFVNGERETKKMIVE